MTTFDSPEVRTPSAVPLERLEAEITELAAHLAAAACRWLLLVAEFDRRGGYEPWGCRTCAHWLSWHCGLDLRSAREKLRVARALEALPAITGAFAAGRLSYSKVRALTRIATPGNEIELVVLAEHATAVHVERIVRSYRHASSADDERDEANRRHAARSLRLEVDDDDGTFVITGRLAPEAAALVLTALDAAAESAPAPGGPAEPPGGGASRADALVVMAESFLAHGARCRKGGDRHHVVVHARDRGCRFPGCGERRFVDVHHVRHRAHGGTNDLGNLVELCWFHHRLVHEGGWGLRGDANGVLRAIEPSGEVLPTPQPVEAEQHRSIEAQHRERGLPIDAATTVPRWYGDPLDLGHIITALDCIDRRSDRNADGPPNEVPRDPA